MKKKILAIALAITTVFTGISWPGKVQAAEVELNVAYRTQDEIRDYIQSSGATLNAALTFAEEPITEAPYALGQLSEDTLNQALKMLNQIRFIAGISYDVTLSEELNEKAQAAALANYVNHTLSHYPTQPEGMSDEMYALAYAGTTSSNLAWQSWAGGSLNSSLVMGWMEDGDAGNIPMVGHRRWVLNPSMGKTGFGAVSGSYGTYSANAVFDRSNTDADESGVAWPAQNMPVEYFDEYFPWSVSMGKTVTASDIQVTLTRKSDGAVWSFSESSADGAFYVNNDGYGQKGCIIFRPDSITGYEAGEEFTVTITGLADGTLTYDVNFFTLEEMQPETETEIETETETEQETETEMDSETETETESETDSETETETESETESETENDVTAPEPTGNLGIISGVMGEKVIFTVENGAEDWSYEWRYSEGENIDNDNYLLLYRGMAEAEVMITKPAAANTYWCHITDANGNEADTIPCRVVCELDSNYVANGICGENITWTLDANGQLTLSGTGSFKLSDTSWRGYEPQITSAIIGEGITDIGAYAFSDMSVIETIEIPGSVVLIEGRAFEDCLNLREIHFLGNAPVIEDYAFYWVKATAYYPANNATWTAEKKANYDGTITWMEWSDGPSAPGAGKDENGSGTGTDTGSGTGNNDAGNNTGGVGTGSGTGNNKTENNSGVGNKAQVGSYLKIGALEYRITGENEVAVTALVSSAKKVTIPKTVSYMGAIYDVTTITDKAFKNKRITQIIIGNNVKTIGASAFESCKKLIQVTIGSGVTKIGKDAFKDCKKLKKITIKSSKLKSIGKNAFKGINSIAKIQVPKKKFSAYKKLLKKKGIGKKVKITR